MNVMYTVICLVHPTDVIGVYSTHMDRVLWGSVILLLHHLLYYSII